MGIYSFFKGIKLYLAPSNLNIIESTKPHVLGI